MDCMTHSELMQVLRYEPMTGEFSWMKRRSRTLPGSIAGTVRSDGYRSICLQRKGFLAHRLAWFYVHGIWPQAELDHINGDRTDNRIDNLRDVSRGQNCQNLRAAMPQSRSQLLGVRRMGAKWQARITTNGVGHFLGTFDSADQAHSAYLDAKRRLHEFCTI